MSADVLTDRRDRILRAAARHFASTHYDKVSTVAIAAEADVNRGWIYHEFGSKRDLYLAVLQRTVRTPSLPPLTGLLAASEDLQAAVAQVVDEWLDEIDANRESYLALQRVHTGSHSDPVIRGVLREMQEVTDRRRPSDRAERPGSGAARRAGAGRLLRRAGLAGVVGMARVGPPRPPAGPPGPQYVVGHAGRPRARGAWVGRMAEIQTVRGRGGHRRPRRHPDARARLRPHARGPDQLPRGLGRRGRAGRATQWNACRRRTTPASARSSTRPWSGSVATSRASSGSWSRCRSSWSSRPGSTPTTTSRATSPTAGPRSTSCSAPTCPSRWSTCSWATSATASPAPGSGRGCSSARSTARA